MVKKSDKEITGLFLIQGLTHVRGKDDQQDKKPMKTATLRLLEGIFLLK
jgi:hypothetical protein